MLVEISIEISIDFFGRNFDRIFSGENRNLNFTRTGLLSCPIMIQYKYVETDVFWELPVMATRGGHQGSTPTRDDTTKDGWSVTTRFGRRPACAMLTEYFYITIVGAKIVLRKGACNSE